MFVNVYVYTSRCIHIHVYIEEIQSDLPCCGIKETRAVTCFGSNAEPVFVHRKVRLSKQRSNQNKQCGREWTTVTHEVSTSDTKCSIVIGRYKSPKLDIITRPTLHPEGIEVPHTLVYQTPCRSTSSDCVPDPSRCPSESHLRLSRPEGF